MLQHPDGTHIGPLYIQICDQHAYCNMIEEEFNGKLWFHDIKTYLRYLSDVTSNKKRTIRRLPRGLFLSGGILYKKTRDLGFLRCVKAQEASTIMIEVHLGVCGPHMNGYVLSKKIL